MSEKSEPKTLMDLLPDNHPARTSDEITLFDIDELTPLGKKIRIGDFVIVDAGTTDATF